MASRSDVQQMLKRQEWWDAAILEGQYVNSKDNFPSTEEEDFVEVADSQGSREFVERDDKERLSTHKERWIQTYSKVLDAISSRGRVCRPGGRAKGSGPLYNTRCLHLDSVRVNLEQIIGAWLTRI